MIGRFHHMAGIGGDFTDMKKCLFSVSQDKTIERQLCCGTQTFEPKSQVISSTCLISGSILCTQLLPSVIASLAR